MPKLISALVAVVLLSGCATVSRSGGVHGGLDFNYEITGDARWTPIAVFNDGVKTIIEMRPTALAQTEAPTLLVVRNRAGLFTPEELVLVNYRVQDHRYIVDAVFDRAVLLAGVGLGQERVTIARSR
ncbi:TrbG/VirB9 family P-type conjugative transfer protein [uncultured Thiodictyon sp.]|uniref:TrbG/VirB9 family P-type conjugative transfer protein n=1 Tax=uncultured Thiodictyon sp. TaxID=1846217 RepID=UPI0025FCB748|nr:TrbG/VirB9 family P-type conjugative transfer protein [uncultured Thiodictyon sp.]